MSGAAGVGGTGWLIYRVDIPDTLGLIGVESANLP
jgi:hypothetical protein